MWIRRLLTASLLFNFAVTTVSAEWKVESVKDRMTDQKVSFAETRAKAEDAGVSARLLMVCDKGQRNFSLVLSSQFTRGRIGGEVRIDESGVSTPSIEVFADPSRAYIISAPRFDVPSSAKRLRVRLRPTGGSELFYDFDLTGIAAARRQIGCP